MNPLSLVVGEVSVEYERGLGKHVSLFVQPVVLAFKSPLLDWPKDSSVFGIGGNVGARVFMTGYAPEGLWIGPQVGVAYVSAKVDDTRGTGIGYQAGGLLGYTFLFGDVVDLSLGGGAGYLKTSVNVNDTKTGHDGLAPLLRLALGVAF